MRPGHALRAPRLDRRADRPLALHGRPRRAAARTRCTSARRSQAGVYRLYVSAGGHAAQAAGGRRMSAGARAGRRRGRRARARAADRRAAPRPARRAASPPGRSAARRSPSGSRRPATTVVLAAAAVVGARVAAALGAWLVAARAVAARGRRRSPARRRASRCTSARRRRTCSCRCTSSSSARRSRSPGSSTATSASLARARPARLAARRCSSAGTGCPFLWSEDLRQGAIDLLFFVLPFGLLAVVARAARLVARLGADALRPARGDGARLRGDRDRPVRDAQHLLEPEGARRQRLRAERLVLPRQLGLLRPVDLRPLPRGRDPREPRRRALRAAATRSGRSPPR